MPAIHITRMARLIGALAILTGGALMPVFAAEQPAVQVDIAAMPPGQQPSDFAFSHTGGGGPTEWRVVNDPTAARQAAIAQTSTDTTDYRFPLAVYKPVSAKNVDVTVRFKPVGGTVD